jgi:hypothetical protein
MGFKHEVDGVDFPFEEYKKYYYVDVWPIDGKEAPVVLLLICVPLDSKEKQFLDYDWALKPSEVIFTKRDLPKNLFAQPLDKHSRRVKYHYFEDKEKAFRQAVRFAFKEGYDGLK